MSMQHCVYIGPQDERQTQMTREQVSLALEAALKQIRFQQMCKPRYISRAASRRANWLLA